MTTKLYVSPPARKNPRVMRHQRAFDQAAPSPASMARIGSTGTQKRSIRCVSSHHKTNTKAGKQASFQARPRQRERADRATAASGITRGLSQSLESKKLDSRPRKSENAKLGGACA